MKKLINSPPSSLGLWNISPRSSRLYTNEQPTFHGRPLYVALNDGNDDVKIKKNDKEEVISIALSSAPNEVDPLMFLLEDTFCRFRSLTCLDLNGNRLKNIDGITSIPILRSLNLSKNFISCIDGIDNLPFLCTLLLGGNQLQCIPAIFRELKLLQELDLSENKIVSLDDVEVLKELTSLKSLYLHGNEFPISKQEYRLNIPTILPKLENLDGLLVGNAGIKIRKNDKKVFKDNGGVLHSNSLREKTSSNSIAALENENSRLRGELEAKNQALQASNRCRAKESARCSELELMFACSEIDSTFGKGMNSQNPPNSCPIKEVHTYEQESLDRVYHHPTTLYNHPQTRKNLNEIFEKESENSFTATDETQENDSISLQPTVEEYRYKIDDLSSLDEMKQNELSVISENQYDEDGYENAEIENSVQDNDDILHQSEHDYCSCDHEFNGCTGNIGLSWFPISYMNESCSVIESKANTEGEESSDTVLNSMQKEVSNRKLKLETAYEHLDLLHHKCQVGQKAFMEELLTLLQIFKPYQEVSKNQIAIDNWLKIDQVHAKTNQAYREEVLKSLCSAAAKNSSLTSEKKSSIYSKMFQFHTEVRINALKHQIALSDVELEIKMSLSALLETNIISAYNEYKKKGNYESNIAFDVNLAKFTVNGEKLGNCKNQNPVMTADMLREQLKSARALLQTFEQELEIATISAMSESFFLSEAELKLAQTELVSLEHKLHDQVPKKSWPTTPLNNVNDNFELEFQPDNLSKNELNYQEKITRGCCSSSEFDEKPKAGLQYTENEIEFGQKLKEIDSYIKPITQNTNNQDGNKFFTDVEEVCNHAVHSLENLSPSRLQKSMCCSDGQKNGKDEDWLARYANQTSDQLFQEILSKISTVRTKLDQVQDSNPYDSSRGASLHPLTEKSTSTLQVIVHRARHLPNIRRLSTAPDTFVTLRLCHGTSNDSTEVNESSDFDNPNFRISAVTSTCLESLYPYWGEKFELSPILNRSFDYLHVTLVDVLSGAIIGTSNVSLSGNYFSNQKSKLMWVNLAPMCTGPSPKSIAKGCIGKQEECAVQIELRVLYSRTERMKDLIGRLTDEAYSRAQYLMNEESMQSTHDIPSHEESLCKSQNQSKAIFSNSRKSSYEDSKRKTKKFGMKHGEDWIDDKSQDASKVSTAQGSFFPTKRNNEREKRILPGGRWIGLTSKEVAFRTEMMRHLS